MDYDLAQWLWQWMTVLAAVLLIVAFQLDMIQFDFTGWLPVLLVF
ncbi:hypothetical protein A2U01_0030949, partial [Trifolium medium]|nr:hypothetical protein [Trifolium medium]